MPGCLGMRTQVAEVPASSSSSYVQSNRHLAEKCLISFMFGWDRIYICIVGGAR